jgi:phosphonate transport system substrate-binding protein
MIKLLSTLYFSCLLLISPYSASQDISFAVVPQQSASRLAELWPPILAYLSEHTGDNYIFATAPDIPTFEKRLLKGEYDVAYMNPYHLTVFSQTPGYIAIAKQTDKLLKGIVVVPKDSEITSLEQLNGHKMAFPSPAAFAASVIPRSYLAARDIAIKPVYVSSHDSVYLNVSKGLFVAGGGVMRTFNNVDEEISSKLKILWQTDGYTPHAFAVLPGMSSQKRMQLQTILVDLNKHPEGNALLSAIKFSGIEAPEDSDWDDIRSLNITLLDHLLK